MAKVGIEIKIDVKKLDKQAFYVGQKGTYATITAFVDLDQLDQYGNSGMVKQKFPQGSQQDEPILGNSKVFWKDNGNAPQQASPQNQGGYQGAQHPHTQQGGHQQQPAPQGFDDVPF